MRPPGSSRGDEHGPQDAGAVRREPAGAEIRAYVGGERVESIVDHPSVAPHINTVAKTYELAHVPEHRDVMTATSHLTGERIHRYTHIFQSADDLVKKIQMLRLLGQMTGTCFQRCVGLDALNAIYAVSYEIDQAEGHRLPRSASRTYLARVQREDLMLAGAMTDPKGHRPSGPRSRRIPTSSCASSSAGRTAS